MLNVWAYLCGITDPADPRKPYIYKQMSFNYLALVI